MQRVREGLDGTPANGQVGGDRRRVGQFLLVFGAVVGMSLGLLGCTGSVDDDDGTDPSKLRSEIGLLMEQCSEADLDACDDLARLATKNKNEAVSQYALTCGDRGARSSDDGVAEVRVITVATATGWQRQEST